MPVRDGQGVVHVIWRREDPERFGALACETSYTLDVRLNVCDAFLVKPSRAIPTCVRCIARLFQ